MVAAPAVVSGVAVTVGALHVPEPPRKKIAERGATAEANIATTAAQGIANMDRRTAAEAIGAGTAAAAATITVIATTDADTLDIERQNEPGEFSNDARGVEESTVQYTDNVAAKCSAR